MEPHELQKNSKGEIWVKYYCPKCAEKLESKLSEAGNPDRCPACGNRFVVPGIRDRLRYLESRLASRELELESFRQSLIRAGSQIQAYESAIAEPKHHNANLSFRLGGNVGQPPISAESSNRLPVGYARPNSNIWLVLGLVAFVVLGIIYMGLMAVSRSSNQNYAAKSEPTYADALQDLMDSVDGRLKTDIFGRATCNGSEATVILEADYFVRLDSQTKQLVLDEIKQQWFGKCYGTKITFKTLDGSTIAEYFR